MAVATPLGSFTHDYDLTTGTERFLVSLDLVGLSTLVLTLLLGIRVLRELRSRSDRWRVPSIATRGLWQQLC